MGSWATPHIARLALGEEVSFRPRGNSMSPRINSGDLVTVKPVQSSEIRKGDIVLCSVSGRHFLHQVKSIRGDQCLIGNMRGGINGWTSTIWGRVEKIITAG